MVLTLRRCLLGLFLALLAAAPQSGDALRDPALDFWRTAAPAIYRVKVETTQGDFVMEIHRDWAPIGADRFYNLVRAGFYDDSRFFRVIAKRFAQFGIAGDPQVAAVWRNQTIADDPVRQSNTRGTFAFAMTGPGARTTQIYINTVDQAGSAEPYSQDRQGFAPLGSVVSGMDVVDKLYSGYGESAGGGMRGGKQGRIFEEGNVHLDRDFPKLDKLIRATIERAE
jgi:cyclophilin family peptidyl-prolyl cis-trans isomerase